MHVVFAAKHSVKFQRLKLLGVTESQRFIEFNGRGFVSDNFNVSEFIAGEERAQFVKVLRIDLKQFGNLHDVTSFRCEIGGIPPFKKDSLTKPFKAVKMATINPLTRSAS